MHAYLLALEIEPVDINRVYVALPLHCTVMPWFYSDKSPAEVVRVIQAVVETQQTVELVSGEADQFGIDKDVPVNRIANEAPVKALHEALYQALQTVGAKHKSSQWIQSGYMPHVTRQQSGRFEEGRRHLVTKLYLAEALEPDRLQQKKIIHKLTLGSN